MSKNHTIYKLPELPLDLLMYGGVLDRSHEAPVITIRPKRAIVPERPATPSDPGPIAHCSSASSFYVKQYVTQVTYPKVTCYPVTASSDLVLARALEQPNEPSKSGPGRFIQQTRFFKLSAFEGTKLTNPMFCTVHGGPWSATVIETEGCRVDCALAPVHWRLTVHEFPDLELQWYGTWHDLPAHIHPTVGYLMNDLYLSCKARKCCSDFAQRCPGGPCIKKSLIDFEDLSELDCPSIGRGA